MSTTLTRLNPKTWLPVLQEYIEAKKTKQAAAKANTAAENAYKALRGRILLELGDARAAVCGNLAITVKEGSRAVPTVTLTTGRVIEVSAITSILVGNETIPGRDIAKVYGGREGSTEIEVSGG